MRSTSGLQNAIAKLTRLYPLYSGVASLANHRLLTTITGTDGAGWAATPGGEVKVDLSDYVGRAAFFMGDIDPKITWVAKKILRPGGTAFDVGANIGVLTLLFSRLVGEAGAIHSFEPNPDVAASLDEARKRAHLTNITLNEIAIGSEDAILELRVPERNRGSASIIRGLEWTSAKKHRVAVTTLDKYVIQRGVTAIDLIKIDIEGAELDLFRGASHVLNDIQPRAIIFEENASIPGRSPVIDFLLSADYGLLSLPKATLRMRARHFEDGDRSHDFVAAKRGRQFDALCASLL
jgi:FkbM family methyltransferase